MNKKQNNILEIEAVYGLVARSKFAGTKQDLVNKSFLEPIEKEFGQAFEFQVHKDFHIGEKIVTYMNTLKELIEKKDTKEVLIKIDRIIKHYEPMKLKEGEKATMIGLKIINDEEKK